MRCIECDGEATVVADHDGVRIGLCERHLRERLAALEGADALRSIEDSVG